MRCVVQEPLQTVSHIWPHSFCAQKLEAHFPGSNPCCGVRGGSEIAGRREGAWVPRWGRGRVAPPFVARLGSEMASQSPGTPGSSKKSGEDGKETPRKSNLPLSLLHIRDVTHRRSSKLPWVDVVRACGRFRLSLLQVRRSRLLPSLNPLAVGDESPPPDTLWMPWMTQKVLWGDQEPLSKVRTAPKGRGCGLLPIVAESSSAGRGPRGPSACSGATGGEAGQLRKPCWERGPDSTQTLWDSEPLKCPQGNTPKCMPWGD